MLSCYGAILEESGLGFGGWKVPRKALGEQNSRKAGNHNTNKKMMMKTKTPQKHLNTISQYHHETIFFQQEHLGDPPKTFPKHPKHATNHVKTILLQKHPKHRPKTYLQSLRKNHPKTSKTIQQTGKKQRLRNKKKQWKSLRRKKTIRRKKNIRRRKHIKKTNATKKTLEEHKTPEKNQKKNRKNL